MGADMNLGERRGGHGTLRGVIIGLRDVDDVYYSANFLWRLSDDADGSMWATERAPEW